MGSPVARLKRNAALSFIGDAIGSITGGILGTKQAAKGAQQAAQTQSTAAEKAIAEQRSARLNAQALEQPFIDAGGKSLAQQMSLLGLNGTADQQTAISALLSSPQYTSATQQGEEAILQNAAATGGLRGGNTQNSLARFRSDLLGSTINDQLARLNTVTSIGQNAAAGTGNNALASANSVSSLLNQQGAALAGGQLAKGNQVTSALNAGLQLAGAVAAF